MKYTGRRAPGRQWRRRSIFPLRRAWLSVALATVLSPVLPTSVAWHERPDPSDLRAHLPEPLQSLSLFAPQPDFVDEAEAALPQGGRLTFVIDGGRSILAERGARVSPRPLAPVQARFAAGQLLTPASLLRPGVATGDAAMRTALAGPQSFAALADLARDFRPANVAPAGTMLASLGREKAARSLLRPGVDLERKDDTSSASVMAAYAPSENPASKSLFDEVLGKKPGFTPPLEEGDHAWAATPLPATALSEKEQTCLATGVYFEARGESQLGQAAVAQVILNRVRNPTYPKTICGVVYQNQNWRNRCQFSFACDGIKDRITNRRAYATAKRIAGEVTRGETWLPEVGSATHYHATYVRPRWARAMEKVDKIGLHIFYRTFNGGWN